MRRWLVILVACSHPHAAAPDAAPADAAPPDASLACYSTAGAPGKCMAAADCTAMADRSAATGSCAMQLPCCIKTPSVADNPPPPPGWVLMQQSQVTPAMTSWAVAILNDPVTYPMFATAMMMFGSLNVLARVEWHPPDFNNNSVHRGVTLYEPG